MTQCIWDKISRMGESNLLDHFILFFAGLVPPEQKLTQFILQILSNVSRACANFLYLVWLEYIAQNRPQLPHGMIKELFTAHNSLIKAYFDKFTALHRNVCTDSVHLAVKFEEQIFSLQVFVQELQVLQ